MAPTNSSRSRPRHQPGIPREGCVRPVVERRAWCRSATGGYGIAILWAMGFPQPATYLMEQFDAHRRDLRRQDHARFRTTSRSGDQTASGRGRTIPSRTRRNFAGYRRAARPEQLGSKTTNNRVTERPIRRLRAGSVHGARRRLVARALEAIPAVRDAGTRGARAARRRHGFEQQGFIEKVEGNRVRSTIAA